MVCPNCGSELKEVKKGSFSCPNCSDKEKKKMSKCSKIIIAVIAIVIVIVIGIYSFAKNGLFNINSINNTQQENFENKNPIATMEIKNYGTVKIELYPNIAPNTVNNFIALANNEYYDGLTFHRIVKDFMIQGGNYNGNELDFNPFLSDIDSNISWDSNKDRNYSIKGEFSVNGFNNFLKHTEGVISMARSDYSALGKTEEGYNSAGSQFFIVTKDSPSLDGLYASFGKVIDGMDIVHRIENVTTNDEIPTEAPVITSIRVDTHGKDYDIPTTIDFNIYSLLGVETTEKVVNTRLKKKQEREEIKEQNNMQNTNNNSTNNSSNNNKIYIHTAQKGCILIYPKTDSKSVQYKYKCEYCGEIGSLQYGCYPLSHGGTYKSSFTCHSCKKSNIIMITTVEAYQ